MDEFHIPRASYNAGFIFLAYLVSTVGCVTTLELLHRRTSRQGMTNWYLLITSSITMGGIGIWCMHFIGNRAIDLHGGNGQIAYSSGYTAASFFLPIIVLFGAFYLLATTERANYYFISASGFLTGAAVCGMHYVGQLGIGNYHCEYRVANVIGAAFIAILASLVALSIFFRSQETWTNNWMKRSLCGCILACAVSGMHWTATVGTEYRSRGNGSNDSRQMSRTQVVIVCTILALVACILLLAIAFVATLNQQRSRMRAQQLVLAGAYFDDTGRIMVTPEGMLPSHQITNCYVGKTFGDDTLTKTHSTFLWAFRASRNWMIIKDLVPSMKQHLETDHTARRYYPVSSTPRRDCTALEEDFATIFKELFCVAAQGLADHIREPMEHLGVLFEEPVGAGITPRTNILQNLKSSSQLRFVLGNHDIGDEPGVLSSAKGQYLFLIRLVNKQEASQLAAKGYRFAGVPQIADTLSKSIQIPPEEMFRCLERMKAYSATENLMQPGIHLTAFILRPDVTKEFDVLVPVSAQSQLPVITLPLKEFTNWQVDLLQSFDNRTAADMLKILARKDGVPEFEQAFRWELGTAVSKLIDYIDDPLFRTEARFSAKQIEAPCQPVSGAVKEEKCILLPFRMMVAIHAQSTNTELTYVPLRYFNTQQQLSTGAVNNGRFAQEVRAEFAHCGDGSLGSKISKSRIAGSRKLSFASLSSDPARSEKAFRLNDTGKRPILLKKSIGNIEPAVEKHTSSEDLKEERKGSATSDEEVLLGTRGISVEMKKMKEISMISSASRVVSKGLERKRDSQAFVEELYNLFLEE